MPVRNRPRASRENASLRCMATIDIYSKRKKRREDGDAPDVYSYDTIPKPLRVQIVHLWRDGFGNEEESTLAHEAYKSIHDILCREYGIFWLSGGPHDRINYEDRCCAFLMNSKTDEALDIIELSFRALWHFARNSQQGFRISLDRANNLIRELNSRFKENAVGYHFESGLIVRVDSALIHAEVVRPALHLLTEEGFQGADDEFRSAHEHYRHGRHKEALVDALKAFESTMKTICKRKSWSAPDNATASRLVGFLLDNALIPPAMNTHFNALRTTLEAGVPTLRNRLGGHGQGEEPIEVPAYLAAYALHLTAANIVMLIDAYKAST